MLVAPLTTVMLLIGPTSSEWTSGKADLKVPDDTRAVIDRLGQAARIGVSRDRDDSAQKSAFDLPAGPALRAVAITGL